MEVGVLSDLLKDLLLMSESRGLAGLIWEPLFTKNVNTVDIKLHIYGSELPVQKDKRIMLFKGEAQRMRVTSFETIEEFLDIVSKWLQEDQTLPLFAKAKSDDLVAIDAILVFVRQNGLKRVLVVAALQMTVAQTNHLLKEVGVIAFSKVVGNIRDQFDAHFPGGVTKEIRFLQPEECLGKFGFSKLQAMHDHGRLELHEEQVQSIFRTSWSY